MAKQKAEQLEESLCSEGDLCTKRTVLHGRFFELLEASGPKEVFIRLTHALEGTSLRVGCTEKENLDAMSGERVLDYIAALEAQMLELTRDEIGAWGQPEDADRALLVWEVDLLESILDTQQPGPPRELLAAA